MRSSLLLTIFAAAMLLSGDLLKAQSNRENSFFFAPEVHVGGSYLGLGLVEVDADRASAVKLGEARGAEITRVEEGSPAEKAGLKPGDILLSYNGENVLGVQQLVRLVQETPEGRKIKVQFWRDGKMQTTTVITGIPGPRLHRTPLDPGLVGLQIPEFRNFTMPDVPNPLLVWRSMTLGIECEPVDSQLAQYFGVKRGVLVRSVEKGSAAEKAGLRAGDVVTAIGDRSVATPRDLSSFMRTQRSNSKSVLVALVRDHKELTVNVATSENPE